MDNDDYILQIIDTYADAISFVKEEIIALEEKKPWKLKALIAQGSTMMRKFNDAREIVVDNPSILENCNSASKAIIIDMCHTLQKILQKKMELLEDAMFVNESLIETIRSAICRNSCGYNSHRKQKAFFPISLDEEI